MSFAFYTKLTIFFLIHVLFAEVTYIVALIYYDIKS